MNKKQQLIELIQAGKIGEDEKKEWELLVNASPDDFAGGMYELIAQFPGELQWLNDTYKRKKEAFQMLKTDKEKGQAMLDAIYHEEKERLEKLLGN